MSDNREHRVEKDPAEKEKKKEVEPVTEKEVSETKDSNACIEIDNKDNNSEDDLIEEETLESSDTSDNEQKEKEKKRKEEKRRKKKEELRKKVETTLKSFHQFFNPEGWFFTTKIVLLLTSAVYNFYVTFFRLSYLFPVQNFSANYVFFSVSLAMDLLMDSINVLDVFISLLTPDYNTKGFLEMNSKAIALIYLKSKRIVIDVLCVLPIDWIFLVVAVLVCTFSGNLYSTLLRYFVCFRILKCVKLCRYFTYFSHLESHAFSIQIHPAVVRVVKYFLLVFMISHGLACLFYLVILWERDLQKTIIWTEVNSFNDMNIWEQYLFAYHWVYVKITGYGGTVPGSFLQTFYCFFVVLCGFAVNISIVGLVSSVIGNYLEEGTEKRQNFERIKLYISYKGIKKGLRQRIMAYYNFTFENNRQWNEGKILSDLPNYLRERLSLSIYSVIIKKVQLFEHASPMFISAVVLLLVPRMCLPNEVIIRRGDVGREMFFLTKGQVSIIVRKKVVAKLKEGAFFGEVALLKRTTRNATVKADTFCDVYVLTKDNFERLEKEFPVEFGIIKGEAKKRDVFERSLRDLRKSSVKKGAAVSAFVKGWRIKKKGRGIIKKETK